MHIHLDPVGGVAGDMFVASLLDAWPELADRALCAIRKTGLCDTVEIKYLPYNDGILSGSRFSVTKRVAENTVHRHAHTHWAGLRAALAASGIDDAVKIHAIGIFSKLAEAEAAIHGKAIEDVVFHEVGNWDSVADIVAASALIDAVAASSWSIGSLPIGSGRVKTAHGELPVPAPATSLLLKGFAMHDDGRPGERVTPTGAAILRYLNPATTIGASSRALARTGFGFGTRKLERMSNVLRVLAFNDTATGWEQDTIAIIQFEIDDQTGEDLAVALDHIRAAEGVLDVTQSAVMGKKGRMMMQIQVLAKPENLETTSETCFRETTTLGLRTRLENRAVLRRYKMTDAQGTRVKIAERPGGITAKAEMDDIAGQAPERAERARRRATAEQEALNVND